MNPFPEKWPSLAAHNRNAWRKNVGCKVLAKYFNISNRPALLDSSKASGHVIVIAGKKRTGGKSVFTHRLLHELSEAGLVPLDLMGTNEFNAAKEDTAKDSCFMRILDWAELEGVIVAEKAKAGILSRNDWQMRNYEFKNALGASRVVIRMPRLDSTLKLEDIADDIKRYVTSAEILEDSIYLYEYSYTAITDWENLQRRLNDVSDGLSLIPAGLLLVSDVMEFIRYSLRESKMPESAIDLAGTEAFFKDLAATEYGLQDSLGDLSNILHIAFEKSMNSGEPQVPSWRVAREYYMYYADLGSGFAATSLAGIS